jgi:8-amino-3,8-dideoxy-alpha-D-manno-octulosonate transaminase
MIDADQRLAIDGGTPVRAAPIDTSRGVGEIGEQEIDAAVEVLKSRSLFRYYGPQLLNKVAGFEAQLKQLLGVQHAVAVTSGTAALQVGLIGLGVEDGDEVIVPAVTFIATVGAVVNARAVPVFAEVDESMNLDPASFEANITPKTKAVIPVHFGNVVCEMDRIMAIARRHNVKVLEDAAQAIGTTYHGKYAGAIGDAGAFSLQLDKNITSGEGGALVTDQWEVYDRAVRYQDQGGQFTISTGDVREHGSDSAQHVSGEPFLGANLRMNELSGAIAEIQMQRLPQIVAATRRNAQTIRARLGDLPLDWRRIPDESGEGGSVMLYLETADLATRFADALRAEGIGAARPYGGRPVYSNPAVLARRTPWQHGCPFNCAEHPTDRTYYLGLCPRSEELLARTVTIGVGPRMDERALEDTITATRKVARHLLG